MAAAPSYLADVRGTDTNQTLWPARSAMQSL